LPILSVKKPNKCLGDWNQTDHIKNLSCINGVYKLTAVLNENGWKPKIKISSNIEKTTDPGIKKAIRYYDKNHKPLADVLYLIDDRSWKIGN